MSNNKFTISTGGGSVGIGNVIQGDNNNFAESGGNASIDVNFLYEKTKSSLSVVGSDKHLDKEVTDVLELLSRLKLEIEKGGRDAEAGSAILKTIRGNFSWAYPLIKDFVSVVWPLII
jgi:hypothetical protein